MLRVIIAAAVVLGTSQFAQAQPQSEPQRKAIEQILPLLERAAAGSADNRQCFTCHSQALPVLALSEAKRRGFSIDTENYQRQLQHSFAHLDRNRDQYLKGKGTGGKADTAGYALWTLAAGNWPADATTAAVTEYLLQWHADDEHWSCTSDRPPSESSDITTTYLAIRGLRRYGTEQQQERIAKRIRAASNWLIKVLPEDNEDRVFRLRGLVLCGADNAVVASAADELIAKQRNDGGWSQLDGSESDAYATATALVALHETGSMTTSNPVYQRGIKYLLKSQRGDGSWHVVSRSDPFQTYFETGFPHGNDQFLSTAASGWAAMALLYTQPLVRD